MAVALGVFSAARFYMVSWLGERVTADLRNAVYGHVLQQSPQFFETTQTGEVLSRLTTDTTLVQTVVGSSLSMGLRNAVMGVGALAMLVWTSPYVMSVVFLAVLLVVLPTVWIGRRVRRLSRDSQDRVADSSAIAAEVLNAVPVVQSYTAEASERRRFADREGKVFLMRFWRKYQDKPAPERLHSFLEGLRITPVRLAAVHRYLFPDATRDEFAAFLDARMPAHGLTATRIEESFFLRRASPAASDMPTISVDRAISSYRRVVALEPTIDALDALARLHMARGEHEEAVPWLSRRLEMTTGAARTPIVMLLAEALLGADRRERAINVLARAVADHPQEAPPRELLLKLYREAEAWGPLTGILQVSATQVTDRAKILEYLYEAAAIFRERLGTLNGAIPVLAQLQELVPDDRGVLRSLGDALWTAGRYAEARVIFEQLLAEFGRRRSPDRAAVHTKLAALARSEGNRIEALAQLELATNMDMANIPALQMLAELAEEEGDMARAERSYRALLLAARRQTTAQGDALGVAEALYELGRLARQRDQAGQASEMLEAATQTALQDDREAAKLQRTLRKHGDTTLLIRVLRSRLANGPEGEQRAQILAELGDALDATDQPRDALELRLQALQDAPTSVELHRSVAERAAKLGQSRSYVDTMLTMVDRIRRKQEAGLAADLLIRSATVTERELGDLKRAEELLGRTEALGHRVVEAWMGMARIAAARGDTARQIELLERISTSADDEMTPEIRAQAVFGLAEIRLAHADTRDAGVAGMRRALEQAHVDPIPADRAGIADVADRWARVAGVQRELFRVAHPRQGAAGSEGRGGEQQQGRRDPDSHGDRSLILVLFPSCAPGSTLADDCRLPVQVASGKAPALAPATARPYHRALADAGFAASPMGSVAPAG